jgi:hypothetical protein
LCMFGLYSFLLHTVKYSELQLISQCEVLRGLIRINNPYRRLVSCLSTDVLSGSLGPSNCFMGLMCWRGLLLWALEFGEELWVGNFSWLNHFLLETFALKILMLELYILYCYTLVFHNKFRALYAPNRLQNSSQIRFVEFRNTEQSLWFYKLCA